MKNKTENTISYIVACLLIWGIGIGACLALGNLKSTPETNPSDNTDPLVETEVVKTRTEGFRITVDGQVQPFREVTYSAEIVGRVSVKSTSAKAGNFVEKGTLLLEIDPRDYELEIRLQQELVNQTNVSIEETDLEKSNTERLLKLANDDLQLQQSRVDRFQNLSKRNAASEAELETAKQAMIQVKNTLQTYENKISMMGIQRSRLLREKDRAMTSLEKAELDLSRTQIVASMNGVITQDNVEQDDYVQRGTVLFKIEDTRKVEVGFHLRMEQLRWIWSDSLADRSEKRQADFALPPLDVNIVLDLDGQKFSWPGTLARYDGAGISPTTRTVPCIAIVDDPSAVSVLDGVEDALSGPPSLMRGMFVSIEIPISSRLRLIEIPTVALRPGNRVWIAENKTLKARHAKIASSNRDTVLLIADDSGIDVGDKVVTSPLPLEVDGMQIRVTDSNSTLTSTEEKSKDVR